MRVRRTKGGGRLARLGRVDVAHRGRLSNEEWVYIESRVSDTLYDVLSTYLNRCIVSWPLLSV
jgi:hypothetical protein